MSGKHVRQVPDDLEADMEEVMRRIGRNISFYRRLRGHTQRELGQALSVETNQVARWERGINISQLPSIMQIAYVLCVPWTLLMLDTSIEALEFPQVPVRIGRPRSA